MRTFSLALALLVVSPQREKDELLAAASGLKKDIVEK
jgi:hypothetical protein